MITNPDMTNAEIMMLLVDADAATTSMNEFARIALEHKTPDNDQRVRNFAFITAKLVRPLIAALEQRNAELAAIRQILDKDAE